MKVVNDTQAKTITATMTYDEVATLAHALKQPARKDAEIKQMLHNLHNPTVKGRE
ncbi:hypothetical protein HUG15_00285 [Salicibibacter cibarius]|uniref:Uncharacterized protein n=1 Tax=Salicibibacter cibarius TaxID=2743000 RepID=A0A7T6YZI4_9BACI|nr:hypothetical protein [Salicibibacter cibarius]QQK74206.1 hypothetical protein HUG15_00285 [Salicibibacter cibarius]